MTEGRRRGAAEAGDPLVQLQVLAAAMAASVAACALVAWAVTSGALGAVAPPPPPAARPEPWAGALVGLASVLLVAAPFLERRLARPPASGASRRSAFDRYRSAKIVGFGLRETAGVTGLVVAVLTGEARWAYALCLGTLVLMGLAWPRAADLPAAARPDAGPVVPR